MFKACAAWRGNFFTAIEQKFRKGDPGKDPRHRKNTRLPRLERGTSLAEANS